MADTVLKLDVTAYPSDECTMCTRARKLDLRLWRVSSSDPDRRSVFVLCELCMDELLYRHDQIQPRGE